MKDQYDDFQDNDDFQHIGLGAGKRTNMTKNQQIYGDFYQAYEQEPQMNIKQNAPKKSQSAYNRFKAGSVIQNYAAECDVHIPEQKPKKKVKLDQQEEQQPQIGQFNLQSFLRDYQQKQELQQINQEQDQQSFTGPFCLHEKVKTQLKLVKIGEQEDLSDYDGDGQINLNEMTFQQYRKLVMKNGKKQQQKPSKKLTVEQKEQQKQFITSYGKGYSMLEKMGFNISKGLGKQQKGITKPVEAVFKTAFTTKDSQLKQQEQKEQESQTQQEQVPAQVALFQYRSKNIVVNNFLLDLKNKFESTASKMYFYERQVQTYDRDFEINNSLKLQKQNQIQQHEQQIKKLSAIRQYGRLKNEKKQINNHKQQLNLRHIYPHLALRYKMDMLFVKNEYLRLKNMNQQMLCEQFPIAIRHINKFLNNFYLQKQRQTVKSYHNQGMRSFKDKNNKVINLQQDEQIDLVDQRPTNEQSVVTVSFDDHERIVKMIQLISENTLIVRINEVLSRYRQISDIIDYKILQCLRVLKQLNSRSQLVKNIVHNKIKPLVFKYYQNFTYQQVIYNKKQIINLNLNSNSNNNNKLQQTQKLLPHLVIFPLFQIMDPNQLQLHRLLKVLSKKMWNIKSSTLFNILKPILEYCPVKQKQHFINFYLSPRLMYQLEQFDMTQPHICKQLMSTLKIYKQLLNVQILKDMLNCTVIPQIVMTYRKYEQQGTSKIDLSDWIKRWLKQIGKIVPLYLDEVLINDFNIQI